MWIVGLVLLALGVAGFFAAHGARARRHAMIAAETLPIAELEEHRSTLADLGGNGGFRKVCEVVGTAHPHPDGPLRAPQSGVECVWYRQTVAHKYTEHYRDSHGHWRRRERTDTVLDQTSHQGYALVDATGIIGVDPNGTAPDGPEKVHENFVPGGPERASGFAAVVQGFMGHGSDTLGMVYTEWVIRPGRPLYILGEVHDRIGPLVIGKPESSSDPFIVSTRSEDELRADAVGSQRWFAWGGAALAVVGLVLTVVDLLT
ncbi:E3 ubiquitin ligase [Actinomycetospora cinnamomea]|uniref:RING-type E3 ubiquitin transferase n=2 Tax=Actinomycetospora cinnamomea TaxID=663609 RepID=A0A2U1FDJ9_9PSEU|nr:E3 ubiquitin ligase [Actinomycetospora cinnamomea]